MFTPIFIYPLERLLTKAYLPSDTVLTEFRAMVVAMECHSPRLKPESESLSE
jgi:hypothetical protein